MLGESIAPLEVVGQLPNVRSKGGGSDDGCGQRRAAGEGHSVADHPLRAAAVAAPAAVAVKEVEGRSLEDRPQASASTARGCDVGAVAAHSTAEGSCGGPNRGDYFVPWHLPFHRAEAGGALRRAAEGASAEGGESAGTGATPKVNSVYVWKIRCLPLLLPPNCWMYA